MKILNSIQIQAVDKATIQNLKISSLDLMEKAARTCLNWVEDQDEIDELNPIHIFCGLGNNGGDGLALARLLSLEFYDVAVYIVHFSDKMSDDFITNFNRAEEFQIHPISIHAEDDFPALKETDLIVDAIFGSGLKKPPTGFTKKLIQHINASRANIISIDIPSGLFIDKKNSDLDSIIKSHKTLSFQLPKLAFLLPDNEDFVPHFELLDIGLDKDFIESQETNFHYTSDENILKFYKKRLKFSHKGNFGHAVLIGGSYGKIGSMILATKAALKVGSGLVTSVIPKCGYQIIQTSVPEAMVETDGEFVIESLIFQTKATVIGLGMGMGTSEKTAKVLIDFLKINDKPIVLDADALNLISKHPETLKYLSKDCILTPHPKELERLIGTWENDYDKIEKLEKFTTKYPFVVVVKGAHTMVIQNGIFHFNSTGNPALAKAGSGDVLTGLIAGLLAQQYTTIEAALMGVFLHGLTADVFCAINSQETFMASDIVHFLPSAFNVLLHPKPENSEDEDDEFDPEDPDFPYNDDDNDSPF